ncbi:VOC family protein [Pleionea litopenaei]|uniref:VOC family protein n=1 Tax=Pleionea litopenaei TaxID=3070815 RepID=A0AA51RRR3_9GAMM|nr:VOC family protein [Pleionea sp. HL-JVS1]WMS86427.1 VOC family protein [Pleionea sp. HL-JVS1]
MAKKILWTDLTVADAKDIRDFYSAVVGWTANPVSMGDYNDFNMIADNPDEPDVGICHARGANADLPPVWMVYLAVDNLQTALAEVTERGGKVLKAPTAGGKYAVIEDPAGAVCALYEST